MRLSIVCIYRSDRGSKAYYCRPIGSFSLSLDDFFIQSRHITDWAIPRRTEPTTQFFLVVRVFLFRIEPHKRSPQFLRRCFLALRSSSSGRSSNTILSISIAIEPQPRRAVLTAHGLLERITRPTCVSGYRVGPNGREPDRRNKRKAS